MWAVAAGLLVGRYGFIAHSRWMIAGIPARDSAFWLTAFLIFISSWYALPGNECPNTLLCRVQNSALPLAFWTFGWYGFGLIPDLSYVSPHDMLLASVAVFSALPAMGLFAVCWLRGGRRKLYWSMLYVAAFSLLTLLPVWLGTYPGHWTVISSLALLALAVPIVDTVESGRPWVLVGAVFAASLGVLFVLRISGIDHILLGSLFVLLGYLLPVVFLQASGRLAL